MLRLGFARIAPSSSALLRTRMPVQSTQLVLHQVRYNSSVRTPEEGKKALDEKATSQPDWNATVLSYEELKPKTLQPTPVSASVCGVCLFSCSWYRTST